jgi:zinc protease
VIDRSQLPVPRRDPPFRFPTVERRQLESGVRLWTVEHRTVPVVALLLVVPSGSSCDPPHAPGLAALTADLLDEGTEARSALELHEAISGIGGQFDTEAGADATLLTLVTLSRFLEEGLGLLGEVAFRPRFDAGDFGRIRDLRCHRLAQMKDVPGALAERAFSAHLYGQHPYAHLPIGTEGSLRALGRDDVAAFHGGWYRPGGVVLVAVGAASHDEIAAAAERAFRRLQVTGDGDGLRPGPVIPDSPPALDGRQLVIVDRPGASQSELRVGAVAVPRKTPDHHALVVLNTVLGGQFVSRINSNLREEKGYTYGARTSFDFRRGAGPFAVQASVQTDATSAALHEIFSELDGIRGRRPVTPEELELAHSAITRGYPRNFQTAEQIARAVCQLALYELPDEYFDEFAQIVAQVDEPAVTAAARARLDPSRMLTIVVGDRAKVEGELSADGFARIVVETPRETP